MDNNEDVKWLLLPKKRTLDHTLLKDGEEVTHYQKHRLRERTDPISL